MTPWTRAGISGWPWRVWQAILMHWRDPLHRSTYILSANQLVTLVSGIVFWILATRFYDSAQIGIASAFLAPNTLFSTLFLFGANHGLLRYAKEIEEDSNLFFSVLWVVLIAGALGGGIGIAVCIAAGLVQSIAGSTVLSVFLYMILVSAGAIWTVCEAALVVLRAPWHVYVRSLVYALARIAILLPFVFLRELGVVLSFTLSLAIVAVLSVGLVRRHLRMPWNSWGGMRHPQLPPLIRFALPNHVVTVIGTIPAMILPLIAIHQLGATVNGHFTLAWTISSIVRSVLTAASVSLLAEGARDNGLLGSRLLRSTAFLFSLVTVTALPMIVVPRWLLLPFGAEYAEANAAVLPLLALSALPTVLFTVFVARERILFRLRYILLLVAFNCLWSTALPFAGAAWRGYFGFALGFLVSQCLLGLMTLPFFFSGRPAEERNTMETRRV
jgi:O-antigen/teichoic acid export membrane protein